jgi:hypothetical protein
MESSIKIKKPVGRPMSKKKNISMDGLGVGTDIKKTVRKTASKTKRGFDKTFVDSGLGKKIASELIDIGADVVLPAGLSALSVALGDPTGVSGSIVGKIAGDQIQKAAEKGGYGLKGKQLTAQKKKMTELFSGAGLNLKHAKQLTNKIFKDGERVLDASEVAVTGGKLNLKNVKKELIKSAKQIWREARPMLKYAGEAALEYGEPLVETGLKTVAMSYGVDPETADLGSQIFTSTLKGKANQGLNRISKKKSQSPYEYVDNASKIVQDKSLMYIDKAEKARSAQIAKSELSEAEKRKELYKLELQIQDAKNAVESTVEKVESDIDRVISGRRRRGPLMTEQDSTGGMGLYSRDDMSTLLSSDSVAKQSFYVRPNIQQGQISGIAGGSFRATGGSFRATGGSFQ